tara:strand:- start:262 stop:477 length:216 start_codon:yes stop_codon:yes gene_type:complete
VLVILRSDVKADLGKEITRSCKASTTLFSPLIEMKGTMFVQRYLTDINQTIVAALSFQCELNIELNLQNTP